MMKRQMKIIFMIMLICGLSACGKPAAKENTDTETTTESTEEMTEATTTEENTEEETPATEDIGEETTEQPEKETDTASVDSKESSTTNRETKDNSGDGYFGTWKVTAYYMPGVSAMSAEDAEGYIGKTCVYSTDIFNGDGEVTDAPDYQEFVETESDFSINYRVTFESVGITGDSVKQVNVSNSYAFGCSFYVKDVNTILICQDGVFFEAVRQ